MMRRMIVGLWLTLLALTAPAQVKTVATYLGSASQRADHLYENQYYKEAIRVYLQALTQDPKNPRIRLRIAESFRHLNNPEQAAWWYGKVMSEKDIIAPEHKLYYAQALLSSGQVQSAEAWYARYQQEYATDERVAQKLRGIDQMPTFYRDSLMYHVRPMDINSPASDFAPAFYQDGLVFISARESRRAVKQVFRWNDTPYLSMFYAPVGQENTPPPALFDQKLMSHYHEGPAVFYDNDTRVIFTRNHRKGQSGSRQASQLGLFAAHRNGTHWQTATPLSLNNPAYSVGHPALSRDGKTLYFISDRPGGQGGTDLYVSSFQNGQWQTPMNLGPSINTEGNEMFPFLHQDQTLYFASDGHGGLGGLDIYRTVLGSDEIENVGYPVNSRYDDFSLILNEEGTRGYYASNRNGDAENDELYQVTVTFQYLDIAVSDKNTQQPISSAEVTLIGDGAIEHIATTDSRGIVRFRINPHHTYIVNVDQPDYEGNAVIIGPEDMLTAEESRVIPLTLIREEGTIDLTVALTDNYTGEPLPYTIVKVAHVEKNDTRYRLTDEAGILRMKVDHNSHYTFSGERGGRVWKHPEIATESLAIDAENTLSVAIGIPNPTTLLHVKAYDADTQAPIERVTLRLIEDGEQRAELLTQSNGEASFRVNVDRSYLVSLEALTHYDDVVIVMSNELSSDVPYRVEMPLRNAEGSISLMAHLYDSVTGGPLANTVVRLRKEGTYNEVRSTSDEQGNVRFKVEEKGSYRISGGTGEQRWSHRPSIRVDERRTVSPQWRIPIRTPYASVVADKVTSKEIPVLSEQSAKPTIASSASSLAQGTKAEPTSGLIEEKITEGPSSTVSPETISTATYSTSRTQPLLISVLDETTAQPVPEAEVVLIGDGAIEAMVRTDADGRVKLDVAPDHDYIIDISQVGYQGNAMILESEKLRDDPGAAVRMLLRPETGTVDLTAQLYDGRTDQVAARTLVRLVNTTTRDTINQVTDEQGTIRVKVEEHASYRLSGKINGTAWSHPTVEASSLTATGENPLRIPVAISETITPPVYRSVPTNTPQNNTEFQPGDLRKATFVVVDGHSGEQQDQPVWTEVNHRIYRLFAEEDAWYLQHPTGRVALTEYTAHEAWWQTTGNQVITIHPVHFAFDGYLINKNAARELDKIVALMKRQPTLRLEAGTHADSRGTTTYNYTLSKQRAQAILAYLMSRGVAKDRILLTFYGEEYPVQPCRADDCSESEHQMNRRAEFFFSFI